MSESPSRTTPESALSLLRRPILIAGLLGGILGGMSSFAASRLIKPIVPVPPLTDKEKATAEARSIVESFLAELKEGKNEEFWAHVKLALTYHPDEVLQKAKQKFDNERYIFLKLYGNHLHQYELLSETANSPSLIQFLYNERYEHGSVLWRFVMYRGKERWYISLLDWTQEVRQSFSP